MVVIIAVGSLVVTVQAKVRLRILHRVLFSLTLSPQLLGGRVYVPSAVNTLDVLTYGISLDRSSRGCASWAIA